jgi:hypothetical protein
MRAPLAQLLFGSLALWLLLAVPAWLLAGEQTLLDTAVACGLCLVPMTATLLWCQWAFAHAPEQQLLSVLGGTSIRLFVAIAGGIGLFHAVPALHRPAFLLWVIVFYLATLALEIVVVIRRHKALAGDAAPPPSPPC